MSSAMLIRNCKQQDFFKLWEMDWAPLPKERDTTYLILTIEHSELSFVAEEDRGNWLGLLLASRSADGNSCFLNHLLVMGSARSKGVGSALVKQLQETSVAEYARAKKGLVMTIHPPSSG